MTIRRMHGKCTDPSPGAASNWKDSALRPNRSTGTTPTRMVVGLIGGIGSGKSSVAAVLHRYGGRIIDADQIGHQVLREPEVRQAIADRWGPDLLDTDGSVNRRKLATIVFASPGERQALEALVHPRIGQSIRQQVDQLAADPACRFIVLDAAIMLEAGWSGACDRLIFVESSRQERFDRVARQRGWSEQQLLEREQAQLPLSEKASRADHVLSNNGSLEQLEQQVVQLLRSWDLFQDRPEGSPR